MKTPRLLVLAALSAFCACHEDPEVITVVVNTLSNGLTVQADGGNASLDGGGVGGVGGSGGDLTVVADGAITAGTAPTPPAEPTVAAAPTTGTTATNAAGETLASGNLLIGTLSVSGNATFQTNNGDIVVSGTLQPDATGPYNITLRADSGTVYVSGTVSTSSTDGVNDGEAGGALTIIAGRVVIEGALNTNGEAHDAGPGGNGGAIVLDANAGIVFVRSRAQISANGGRGTTTGGNGGAVDLESSSTVHLFGALNANGGAATGAATPTGGNAGDLALDSQAGADIFATLSLRGGDADGDATGAAGGAGGDLNLPDVRAYRIFGSLDQRGGTATAAAVGGGALTGGTGGSLNVPQALQVDLGAGTFSTSGGGGGASGGGAGDILLQSDSGALAVASDLVARGGPGLGLGPSNGGTGGAIRLETDFAGNVGIHPVTLLSEGSLTSSGGAAGGGGAGGTAGTIRVEGGADLTIAGPVAAAGGAATSGNGGSGNTIDIVVSAAAGTPRGDITLSGSVDTRGAASTSGTGGAGRNVTLTTPLGSILSTAAITLSAGAGGSATSAAGALSMTSGNGDVVVSGSIASLGGSATSGPTQGGAVTLLASAGSVLFSGTLDVSGGGSKADAASGVAGAPGGDVRMEAHLLAGFVALTFGASITSNGGASTGVQIGGTGGEIELVTDDAFISVVGTIRAAGGPALGTNGFGGLGGAFLAHSDGDNDGTGGDITLASGASVDVSGGTGPTAGSGRSNGPAVNGTNPGQSPTVVAVQLDADGLLGNDSDSPVGGIVINNGSIVAGGLFPGDVLFDGRDASGVAATAPAPGTITPAPSMATFEAR